MSRYFVTGATGFLGGELVKQLIGRGHQVAALVRLPEKAALLKVLGADLHVGDITDCESLRTPMHGVDGVFHTAAHYKIGSRGPAHLYERVNVEGTRHVLDLARELGIARVVYVSTVAVFGDTHGRLVDETYRAEGPFLTEYDRTKWLAHYQVALPLMRQGLPLIIAMPGTIYGPGDTSQIHDTIVQMLRGRLHTTPRDVRFCWGHVDDIARGVRQAMEAGRVGESYLLTGPVHTFEDALATAARLAGKRPPMLHPGPVVMRTLAAAAALLERWKVEPPVASETLRLMAGTTWIGTSAKAERELGFKARPLEEGLRHTLEHEMRQLGMA